MSPHALVLTGLAALFFFRVAAQFIQAVRPSDLLAPFEAWQGSNLPYPWLATSQIAILIVMAWLITRILRGTLVPNKRLGKLLFVLGGIYFAVMFARLIGGLTLWTDVHWFAARLPAFFHMVLASVVLVLAHYHACEKREG